MSGYTVKRLIFMVCALFIGVYGWGKRKKITKKNSEERITPRQHRQQGGCTRWLFREELAIFQPECATFILK